MLSKIAPPLLIFTFYSKAFANAVDQANQDPDKTKIDWSEFGLFGTKIPLGLPIPIPLLPETFGLVDDGDTNTFSIRSEKFGNMVLQRGLDHEVQAKYRVRKGSTLAQVVLPLIEKCFEFMDKDLYDVSYLNNETLIFNGKVSDFQTLPNARDNDLLDMSFSITTNPSSLGFDTLKDKKIPEQMVEGGNILIPR